MYILIYIKMYIYAYLSIYIYIYISIYYAPVINKGHVVAEETVIRHSWCVFKAS